MNLTSKLSKSQIKVFVYPQFKAKYGDFIFFRLNGSGLGNNLFVWAKYIVFIQKHGAIPIYPTWIQFNLTKSKHLFSHLKRHNIGLFRNTGQIGGFKKALLLLFKGRIDMTNYENIIFKSPESLDQIRNKVVIVSGMHDYFEYFVDEYRLIREKLYDSLKNKYKIGLNYDFGHSISLHIRLGDFINPKNENELKLNNTTRIDLVWYKNIIHQIRSKLKKPIKVFIFSDGSDYELKTILEISNTRRLKFGSAMADLIALSNSNILIASGSTYSMWASFLGRMPVVWYNGKLKQKIYLDQPNLEMECSPNNKLSNIQLQTICDYLE